MKKVLLAFGSLMFIFNASAYELNVKCNNIVPKKVVIQNGGMLTDTFILHEQLGYFDSTRRNYGLLQRSKIINAKGEAQDKLSVASHFYPNGSCGSAKIIADNKSEDRVGNDATVRITIEIQNVCDAKNTSRYTLERDNRVIVSKSFTQCSYQN